MTTELYSRLSTLHSLLSFLYFPFSTLHCLLGDCVIPFSFPIARDEAHAGQAITMITPSEEGRGLKAIRYIENCDLSIRPAPASAPPPAVKTQFDRQASPPYDSNYARTKYGRSSRTTTSFGQRARDARACRPSTVLVNTLGDKLAVTLRDGPRRNSSAKRVHPTTLRPIRHKNNDAGILDNL